jgi:CBS domain-containing protein
MDMIARTRTKSGAAGRLGQPLPQVDRDASVLEASRLMSKSGRTKLLVTHQTDGTLQPLAVLTAKDIVNRVVAAGLDPAVLTAGDIAWSAMPATAGGRRRVCRHTGLRPSDEVRST